jgi:hypothetical protein
MVPKFSASDCGLFMALWRCLRNISCTVLAVAVMFTRAATAQTETAQISGSVVDQTGSLVTNAAVTAQAFATESLRKVRTNDRAVYTLMNLPPGFYRLVVEAEGFSPATRTLELQVGAQIALDFSLTLSSTETTVTVSSPISAVPNTETPTLGTWINSRAVTDLPTITRNPYDLALDAGNVSESDPSVGAGNPRGVGIAINGLRSPSTNVMLDGGNNNDEFNAVVGQQVPLDSVQEFSVLTNNFTARYGRASGGIVNVVTKSGGNSFHGSLYTH